MQGYAEYKDKLKKTEEEENKSSTSFVENKVPAGFLLIFALISGGATYYLNHVGLKGSPLFDRTIGSHNAVLLVLIILEGSFLSLTLLGYKILKSKAQRIVGAYAITALKIVLSLNILVSFILLSGFQSMLMGGVTFYSHWGVPLTVIGGGWLWTYIVVNRRRTIIRNQMLDNQADIEQLWADQHKLDQQHYRDAYRKIADSQEMQEVREKLAVRAAIDQIAKENGTEYEDAEMLYSTIQDRQQIGSGQRTRQIANGKRTPR